MCVTEVNLIFQLSPNKHYVPFKSDLSNLVDQLNWIRENDDIASKIIWRAQKFANENLLPQHVFCYHAVFLKKWALKLKSDDVIIGPKMVRVTRDSHHPSFLNDCPCIAKEREEL
jgi:hypothetical protein